MRSIIGFAFFATTMFTFVATSQPLQERYGRPVAETYQVKPGVGASARYGASGQVCLIVVRPEKPHCPLNSPRNTIGDYEQTKEIVKELVPESERGKYVIGGFANIFCGTETDCFGSYEHWEKLFIFFSGSNQKQHYASIRWERDECHGIDQDIQ
jgi:hypothetical protein